MTSQNMPEQLPNTSFNASPEHHKQEEEETKEEETTFESHPNLNG
jgi:hypothetical protein